MQRLFGLLFGAIFAVAASGALASEELNGRFLGVDGAEGFAITLTPQGETFTGTLKGRDGATAPIQAKAVGGGAQAPMSLGGRKGFARIAPQPVGLSLVWMPLGADGSPIREQAQIYAFRRDTLALPSAPAGYRPPPEPDVRTVDPIAFINSYAFWPPGDAARVYDQIERQHRSLMRLYPALHADMIWRLCESPAPPRALGEALRGESLVCTEVDRMVREGQSNGRFSAFKARVARERQSAVATVGCAQGLFTDDICARAAQSTQQAALSLDTASTILATMQ